MMTAPDPRRQPPSAYCCCICLALRLPAFWRVGLPGIRHARRRRAAAALPAVAANVLGTLCVSFGDDSAAANAPRARGGQHGRAVGGPRRCAPAGARLVARWALVRR